MTGSGQMHDLIIKGGVVVGSLANGGVDLAPLHDMETMVPDELKKDIAAIRQQIVDGTIKVGN